jgi:3-oxoacyl-[acyl-carrier-protein] synthase-3
MHSTVGLLAPRYVVGEHEVSVETIDNRLDVLRQHDMPDVKELWGWDTYRRTDLDLVELTATCVNQTLADAGLRPGQIDHVIALGWDGDGFDQTEQSPFIEALSERLDFRGKVTLIKRVGCAWMAFAIHHAKMLLDQGSHHVLVVTAGKLADDAQRFQCYGVISDSACSFVLTDQPAEFTVCGVAVKSSSTPQESVADDFQGKCELIYAAFEELNASTEFDQENLAALFGNNTFLPVQELELSAMPVDGMLAYQTNTTRYGHCFAADTIINLIDYHAEHPQSPTTNTLLAPSSYGHFGLVLLKSGA